MQEMTKWSSKLPNQWRWETIQKRPTKLEGFQTKTFNIAEKNVNLA